ncbi:MAG: energy transducer TonB [Motiliproteus sp.]
MALAATSEVQVTSVDRLGFTLFVAVAVHAIILLGIGFEEERKSAIAHTLEVTLAQFESDNAPEKADFIAQKNQLGSGESDKKAIPTTTERALFQANEAQQVAAQSQSLPVPDITSEPVPAAEAKRVVKEPAPKPKPKAQSKQKQQLLVTESRKAKAVVTKLEKQQQASKSRPASGMATSLLARSLEIASLEAKLDLQNQELANRPRVRTLYSASTRESYDAAYLDAWRRKVERVGNLNYPEEAHRRGLYGYLRLLVVIEPDGAINRIEVLRSSGYSVLDDAAKRIVLLSAPFAAFPPEISKRADLVEIIRTWRFERSRIGIRS